MPLLFSPDLPDAFPNAVIRLGVARSRFLLLVRVAQQDMWLFERVRHGLRSHRSRCFPLYAPLRRYRISTSRFGVGQVRDSLRTPLGLHRIAQKIGGGWPVGTVFEKRQPVGYTWDGRPDAAIAHRILWLEGLEDAVNRGGEVDSFRRFIYLHGLGDEPSIGRPASRGCVHLAAADLIPLYDRLPVGTLVWIAER